MTNNDDLIEAIKRANPIADVIGEEAGYATQGRGRYLTTREHDSLVIDTHTGSYYWNSTGEHGDVIEWVMKRRGWDFKSAVEFLCRRAGMPEPDWGKADPAHRLAARAREDALTVAATVFHGWMLTDQDALRYAHGRGWTDGTITRAMLGYTGGPERKEALRKALIDAMGAVGVDSQSAAAVSVLGYSGDVLRWSHENEVSVDDKWIEQRHIPGIVGWDMIVYPHLFGGRIRYLSTRGIREKRHYNLPGELVGERQPFFNWEWSSQSTQCVIVEGQADAITLAQWGLPAMALCGVHADERLLQILGKSDEKKSIDFYIGLDSDQAGEINKNKIAELFGPMTRLIKWAGIGGVDTFIDPVSGEEREVKDANDLLRGMSA